MSFRASGLLLPLAFALGSCCTDPVDQSTYFCLGDMSTEEEIALGTSYAPTIDAMYDGVYADADADAYLSQLVVEMAGHSVYGPSFPWKFSILNTSMPNAFAVPGGYVYITRGLLAAMETEGQFISVMGHELGHVEHRHSHQGMGRSAAGGVIVSVLDAVEPETTRIGETGLISTVGAGVAQLTLLSYSRGQESESDSRGIYYAATMGYDPNEAVKTFEYFQKLEAESGGSQIAWLRTHPLNEDRIADIREQAREQHPELIDRPKSSFRPYKNNNTKFSQVVQRIESQQPVYDRYDAAMSELSDAFENDDKAKMKSALAKLQGCASDLPNEALFSGAVGYAQLGIGDFSGAKSSLEKAVQLDRSYLPDRNLWRHNYLLGAAYYESGDMSSAKTQFELAAKEFPDNPSPHYQLGMTYEKLTQKQNAIGEYKKVIAIEGDPNGTMSKKAQERIDALKG